MIKSSNNVPVGELWSDRLDSLLHFSRHLAIKVNELN